MGAFKIVSCKEDTFCNNAPFLYFLFHYNKPYFCINFLKDKLPQIDNLRPALYLNSNKDAAHRNIFASNIAVDIYISTVVK